MSGNTTSVQGIHLILGVTGYTTSQLIFVYSNISYPQVACACWVMAIAGNVQEIINNNICDDDDTQ